MGRHPLGHGSWPLAACRWPLVAGCWSLVVAACAADGPSVDLSASPSQVAVGDSVAVTVTYRWPHGWSVAAEPDPAADFRDQFVTAAPPAERSSTGEEERRTFHYTLAAGRSGAWLLPRPSLAARGPHGAETVRAPEVIVQVGAEAAPAHLPEPLPVLVRPPAALAADRRWWWIAGGAGLVATGTAIWLLRRRRGASAGPTPWQLLAGDLAAVRAAGDGLEAGARLSLALRRYAGGIWRFDGPGLTTRETGAALRRLPAGRIADDEARELLRLLGRLDDLRWSGAELPAAAVSELATLANAWADRVQRRLDAEAAAAATRKAGA